MIESHLLEPSSTTYHTRQWAIACPPSLRTTWVVGCYRIPWATVGINCLFASPSSSARDESSRLSQKHESGQFLPAFVGHLVFLGESFLLKRNQTRNKSINLVSTASCVCIIHLFLTCCLQKWQMCHSKHLAALLHVNAHGKWTWRPRWGTQFQNWHLHATTTCER